MGWGWSKKPESATGKHKHTWKADRWRSNYLGTFLQIQCLTCGVAKEIKIADFQMSKEQVALYISINYPPTPKEETDGPA